MPEVPIKHLTAKQTAEKSASHLGLALGLGLALVGGRLNQAEHVLHGTLPRLLGALAISA